MKLCTKCEAVKPLTEFHSNKSKKDGLAAQCMVCANASAKKRYEADTRKTLDRVAVYRSNNREKILSRMAAVYAADPIKFNKRCSVWLSNNPQYTNIKSQNRRARKCANGGVLSHGLSEKLFKLQRGKCACGCKQPLGKGYHLDHRMPLALGGSNTDDNMQLLRSTCNMQKHAKHPIDFMQQRGFLL